MDLHRGGSIGALFFTVLTVLSGSLAGFASAQIVHSEQELQLSGLEPSEAALYASAGAVRADSTQPADEIVLRLAWRTRKLPQEQLDLAATDLFADGTSPDDFSRYQFRAVRVCGSLTKIEPWPALDPDATPPFWKLSLTIDGGPAVVAVVSWIPAVWQKSVLPLRRVCLSGLVVAPLQADKGDQPGGAWLLASHHAHWMPETVDEAGGITAGVVALGEHGFDAGMIDEIRRVGSGPMRVGERVVFDAFLNAVSRTGEADWARLLQKNEVGSIATILRRPDQVIASPVGLQGTVRRVTEIGNGIHQLELFVETGRKSIGITNAAGERIGFGPRLPVTVVLPESVAMPDGTDGSLVAVDAYAYRFWSYESGFSAASGIESGQTVPLVVGWRVRLVETGRATVDAVLGWAITLLVGAVGMIVVAVWWMNRRDTHRRRTVLPDAKDVKFPEL